MEGHSRGHLKLTNVEVGRSSHLSVLGDDIDDQRIAYEPYQHDEGEEERHQPGVRQERVLPPFFHVLQGEVPS